MLLLDTLPMLGNVLMLCSFVFFIFGVVAVQLWAGTLRQRCFLDAEVFNFSSAPNHTVSYDNTRLAQHLVLIYDGLLFNSDWLKGPDHFKRGTAACFGFAKRIAPLIDRVTKCHQPPSAWYLVGNRILCLWKGRKKVRQGCGISVDWGLVLSYLRQREMLKNWPVLSSLQTELVSRNIWTQPCIWKKLYLLRHVINSAVTADQ